MPENPNARVVNRWLQLTACIIGMVEAAAT
jgi:hypothetical protein